ncbi:MAG: pyruvate-formate lyase [Chloroflexi bacterium]|nr:pyruvate-formate lyase [Chloroflexota bacterium]
MSEVNDYREPTYQERIEALRITKNEHTDRKVQLYGYFDTDDHGYIPWEEPIPFQVEPNHPNGGAYGMRAIGRNFRHWLEVHPLYIHPMSALAGAWVRKGIPGLGGWRPEDRPTHLMPIFERYHVRGPGIGAMNHLGPDMTIGLDLGWGGLLEKLRRYRALNRPADTSFYDGEEDLVLGIQTWIRRHVDYARAQAAMAEDPFVRRNLSEIADMNEYLVDGAPRTLREACQFLAWAQSVDRMWHLGGAMGQLDEMLRPYYEADKLAGRLTDDEEAVWYLASLFFNDPHYSQIGGPAPDGHDVTSEMSFIILEAAHRLRIPSNLAIRLHDGLNPALLRRSVEYLFQDGTGPSYACSKGLDEGFARNGFPIQLARLRAKVGCNWTALPGIEYCLQDVTRVCLVQPFLFAWQDVMAARRKGETPEPGEALPAEEGWPTDPTLRALWARYVHHLGFIVATLKEGKDWHMAHQADNAPEIVLNLFCHGTIERGLDASAGGVDIYDLAVDGLGLATVADSFAAIELRVVNEGRLTWEELDELLANNWAGPEGERARLMMKNIKRYGAGDSLGDKWAKHIADLWTHLVRDTPTPNGFIMIPGLFSHGGIAEHGKGLGATPNGRRAGEAISHSADPDPGFTPGGGAPTAKANAVAMVQPGWGNTTPLQIDFDRDLANSLGGVEAIEAFLKAHNAQGGTLININIISKEQILEAHEDPTKHPDLLVRVTGYSAYFRSLSKEYRQQIVDRILAAG